MAFIRQFLPAWIIGPSESQPSQNSFQLPKPNINPTPSGGGTGWLVNNSKPLTPITDAIHRAESALEMWIINFQGLNNQIKLPKNISPTAKSIADKKLSEDKVSLADSKTLASAATVTPQDKNKNKISLLPNTRLENLLNRVIDEIEPNHAELIKLANNSPSLFKPAIKDREIKMGELSIKIARQLRDMIDDVKVILTECFLEEDLGEKLIPLVPIAQRARELVDLALKKHIQATIDKMQDHLNKYALDFMKSDRILNKYIEGMKDKSKYRVATPDNPEAQAEDDGITLTLPSAVTPKG